MRTVFIRERIGRAVVMKVKSPHQKEHHQQTRPSTIGLVIVGEAVYSSECGNR
jgi:hypothetical protein